MEEKINEIKEEEINENNVIQTYEKLVQFMKEAVNKATSGRKISNKGDMEIGTNSGKNRKSSIKDW